YTNAGKSTLFNALTKAAVYVENMPFATLDPTTRVFSVGRQTRALLTDTVGFIRKLPPHLVASFRATLEEVTEADLLIHVVDATETRVEARWDVEASASLTPDQRARLREALGARLGSSRVLRVVSQRHRSQSRNKEAALERLQSLVARALAPKKKRRPTAPT